MATNRLLRRLINTATDDDVLNIASSFGLGQTTPNDAMPPFAPTADNAEMLAKSGRGVPVQAVAPPITTPPPDAQPVPISVNQQFDVAAPAAEMAAKSGQIPFNFPTTVSGQAVMPGAAARESVEAVAATETATAKPFNSRLLRTSADIQTAIRDNQSADIPRERSAASRFFRGLGRGIQTWAENGGTGGLAGLAGAGLTGGVGSAASKGFDAEMTRGRRGQKLLRQLGQAQEAEAFQAGIDLKKAQTRNEQMEPVFKQAELQRKVNDDLRTHQFKIDEAKAKAIADGNKYDIITNPDGKVFQQYTNDPSKPLVPVIDPDTKEQLIDPHKRFYDVYDKSSGLTVKATGDSILTTGASKEASDATREQSTRQFNANNQLEVDKQNIANQLTYQNQVNQVLSANLANDASLAQYGGNVAGLRTVIDTNSAEQQRLLDQLNRINEKDYSGSSDAEIKAANEERTKAEARFNKLADDTVKANSDLLSELGKTEAGKIKADQLKSLMPKAPARLSFKPIQAVKVSGGGGKSVFTEQQARDYYKSQGKSDAEINGLISKGKAQKLIN